MKTMLDETLRLVKGAAFAVGVAVVLALTVGVATTALAAVPGDPLKLGQSNTIGALTRLAGSVGGPMLVVDNDSAAAGARALDLRVEPGRAPMAVSAGAGKAKNLDVDKLDGKDSAAFVGTDRFGAAPESYGREGAGTPSGDCMVGEVVLFAGTRAPNGFAWADGELIQIQENEPLFSLLGTQFGGDGQTTFALPDMRGIEPDGARYMVCEQGVFPSSTD